MENENHLFSGYFWLIVIIRMECTRQKQKQNKKNNEEKKNEIMLIGLINFIVMQLSFLEFFFLFPSHACAESIFLPRDTLASATFGYRWVQLNFIISSENRFEVCINEENAERKQIREGLVIQKTKIIHLMFIGQNKSPSNCVVQHHLNTMECVSVGCVHPGLL